LSSPRSLERPESRATEGLAMAGAMPTACLWRVVPPGADCIPASPVPHFALPQPITLSFTRVPAHPAPTKCLGSRRGCVGGCRRAPTSSVSKIATEPSRGRWSSAREYAGDVLGARAGESEECDRHSQDRSPFECMGEMGQMSGPLARMSGHRCAMDGLESPGPTSRDIPVPPYPCPHGGYRPVNREVFGRG
jgi:hypothetical protein